MITLLTLQTLVHWKCGILHMLEKARLNMWWSLYKPHSVEVSSLITIKDDKYEIWGVFSALTFSSSPFLPQKLSTGCSCWTRESELTWSHLHSVTLTLRLILLSCHFIPIYKPPNGACFLCFLYWIACSAHFSFLFFFKTNFIKILFLCFLWREALSRAKTLRTYLIWWRKTVKPGSWISGTRNS